jgi:translocation and assembly module TamA
VIGDPHGPTRPTLEHHGDRRPWRIGDPRRVERCSPGRGNAGFGRGRAAGSKARSRLYRRILGALYDQGHYGGAISILVGGTRGGDVLPPDAELPDPAAVELLKVDAGPLFRFGRIGKIANRAPDCQRGRTTRWSSAEVDRLWRFRRSGAKLDGGRAGGATLAVEAWRQLGYAEAASGGSAGGRRPCDRHGGRRHHRGDPGRQATLSGTGEGAGRTTRMDPGFVAQQTGLRAGAEYDPDDIARAEKRLARLDVFRAMRIEAASGIGSGRGAAVQRDRRGAGGAALRRGRDLLERRRAGARRRSTCGATCSGGPSGCGSTRRSRASTGPIASAEFDYAFGGTFTKPGFPQPGQ